MGETISVFVNNREVKIYRGMLVKHALISYDDSLFKAAKGGKIVVEDERGFRVGLEGSLREGSKLYTRPQSPG